MQNWYQLLFSFTLLWLLLILTGTDGMSQLPPKKPTQAPAGISPAIRNPIPLGHRDSLYSNLLKEQRRLFIYLPPGATNPARKQAYPVVYLLDGGMNFVSFVGIQQYLSEVNRLCTPMIVVGILNTDRMRDLTPTRYHSPRADSLQFATSGGAETFTQFLAKELIPYIEAQYPTTSERMLIGHSLGGLLVLNTFLYHTNLFEHYLAIDPSLTWDDGKLLGQYLAALPNKKFTNTSLFLSAANFAQMDSTRASHDTTRITVPTRSIFSFARALRDKKDPGLDYACRYYPLASHFTVPLPSEQAALQYFFRKKPISLPVNQLQPLVGKYRFQLTPGKDDFLQVSIQKNHLLVQQLWDGAEFILIPESELRFYCQENPYTISFVKDAQGQIIQAVVMNQDRWQKVTP